MVVVVDAGTVVGGIDVGAGEDTAVIMVGMEGTVGMDTEDTGHIHITHILTTVPTPPLTQYTIPSIRIRPRPPLHLHPLLQQPQPPLVTLAGELILKVTYIARPRPLKPFLPETVSGLACAHRVTEPRHESATTSLSAHE